MKNLAILFALALLASFDLSGQTQVPQAFRFQSVLRDANGNFITTPVTVRLSILSGSPGTPIYQHVEPAITPTNGLISVNMGTDNPTDFAAIDWASGPYFLKVEMIPSGGSTYEPVGNPMPILSVPYSLLSDKLKNEGYAGTPDGRVQLGDDANGNPYLELRATDGAAASLYIDFSADATVDRNARIAYSPTNKALSLQNLEPDGIIYLNAPSVGIGTPGTAHKLEVRDNRDDDYVHAMVNNTGNGGAGLWLHNGSNTSTGSTVVRFRNANLAGTGPEYWTIGNDRSDGNKFKITPYTFDGSSAFVIDRNGRVGIGTSAPNSNLILHINGDAGKPGGGSWANASDRRLKTSIQDFHLGLDILKAVKPINYHYNGKLNLPTEEEYVGVIAQELQQIAPFMVKEFKGEDGETYLNVDPSAFTFILINAVKEQQQLIARQASELEQLKQQNLSTAARLERLEAKFSNPAVTATTPGKSE